jgi:hypothetical protein
MSKEDTYCTLCGARGHMAKDCKWLRVCVLSTLSQINVDKNTHLCDTNDVVNSEVSMKYKFFNGIVLINNAFVTGERPVQSFGILGGRSDFDTRDMRVLWDGCLDSPEYIPNGKVIYVKGEHSIVPGSVPR